MPASAYIKSVRQKIGHDFLLLPGVLGIVFDEQNRVLLGRRADNGKWAVIGGAVDPGEEPAVAVLREVLEETGIVARIDRVSGVYTTRVITYPNGDVVQYVSIAFRCTAMGGRPTVGDDESLEVAFFPLDQLPTDVRPEYVQRIRDAAAPGLLPAVFAVGAPRPSAEAP
jgi:8-oxo-dGTP pyrophosphatase MutT (NUDIX family)